MKLKKWIAAILMVLMTAVTATAFAACSPETEEPPEEQVSGPEVGVYYYDTTADEYQISLSEGNVFTFLVMGENKTGTYTLTGEELVLDFARAEDGELTATLSGDELSLTYRESAMRFLKKIEYTVTFDSAGGESVSPVTVINGRTVSRPEDPTQDGMLFVGWYKDEAHTQPFLFDAEPVRANSTLYAYWVARTPGMSEYTVEFDLNGGDGETPAGVSTIGGTIPADQLPTAERDGYTFLGWYVSAYDNASKPTYEYTAGTVLTENTTLYAQWAAEAEPAASVSAAGVTWECVSGAQTYYVRIESDALDANADYDSGILSGTTYALDFSALPAGEYTVTVLSSATQNPETDADAAQSVRYYRNKALSRVTGLDVTADMVHWEPVDGAQCYYLTIDCGNDAHVHEGLSVGSATSLPISGCAMQEGGIRITVWAEADGLLASTPVTYVYDRTLAQVSGFEYDEETETLYWSPVADAIGYVVSVSVDGSSVINEEIGSRTSYSLKGIPAGEVVFAIYPVTKGYNSPVASEYEYTKETPETPSGLYVDGTVVSWNATGADVTYTVEVNGTSYTVNTNSYTLNTNDLLAGAEFTVRVRTNGTPASLWSDSVTFEYLAMSGSPRYEDGVLSWDGVAGATGYVVEINGEEYTVEGTTYEPELQAGVNEMRVRFLYGDNEESEWSAYAEVNAYTLTYDTREGSAVSAVYAAYGDTVTLPEVTRAGYTFRGWYNIPGGGASNGTLYGIAGDEIVFEWTGSVTLYAYWENMVYSVALNANGGTADAATAQITYAHTYSLGIPEITDGRVFLGWYDGTATTANRLTDENGDSLAAWTYTDPVTLYAHWVNAITYTRMSDGYSVSAGADIAQVNILRIPATLNDVPVTFIGSAAFENCVSLREVYIPDSVDEMGTSDDTGGPFVGCANLTGVHVYETENSAGIYSSDNGVLYRLRESQLELAFYPAGRTGGYVIPDGVQVLPARIFAGSRITSITIPTSVTRISQSAFYNCTQLTSVVFSEGNGGDLTISDRAFHNCTALTSITLPARLATLGEDDTSTAADEGVTGVFTGCTQLTHIYTENNVATASGHNSADGLIWKVVSNLNTLVYCPLGRVSTQTNRLAIPNGIVAIGESAFEGSSRVSYISIPSSVQVIGDRAFASSSLNTIVFEGGAAVNQTIGNEAFMECDALGSVQFAADCRVTTIGEGAFSYCTGLRDLTLPASLVSVEANAFAECTNLKSLTLQGSNAQAQELSIASSAFANCANLTEIALSANVGVFDFVSVFEGCPRLTTITVDKNNQYLSAAGGILYSKNQDTIYFYSRVLTAANFDIVDSVKTIGSGAFANNVYLESVTIGAGVTSIEEGAFENNAALAAITFEEGADLTIDANAFAGCTALTTLNLSGRVTSVGESAFEGTGLATLTLNEGLKTISARAFYGTNVGAVTLPDTLTTIGTRAFYGTDLTSVNIPTSVTSIGSAAFAGISTLTEFTFEQGGTAALRLEDGSMDSSTGETEVPGLFAGSRVDDVILPARLAYIGDYALAGISTLTDLNFETATETVLSQLKELGDYAFAQTPINDFALPDTVTAIGAYAFAQNTSLETIDLPAELATLGEGAFYGCSALQSLTIDSRNSAFAAQEGVLYSKDMTQIVVFPAYKQGSYTLPTSVATIAAEQFLNSAITSVTLHSGVTSIGANAFDGSAITSIVLPAGLATLGDYAFANTESLGAVTFGIGDDEQDAVSALTAIPASAFRGSAVTSVDFSKLTQLTSIGNYAFYNCTGLTTLNFPTTLVTVGEYAFSGCTGLTEVDFDDNTVLESIGQYAFDGAGSATAPATVRLPVGAQGWALGYYSTSYSSGTRYAFVSSNFTQIDFATGTRITEIPQYTFSEMARLTSIAIPEGVTSIGNYAFRYSSALQSVTLSTTVTSIGNYAFSETGLQSVTIPATVTSIGGSAFRSNTALQSVTFADGAVAEGSNSQTAESTVSLGNYVFQDCTALTTVVLSNRVTALPTSAFNGCSSLASGSVASGDTTPSTGLIFSASGALTSIGNTAFAETALTSITLPEGLTTLASGASSYSQSPFYMCASLTSVTLPSTLTAIGGMALSTASANNASVLRDVYVTGYTYTTGSDEGDVGDFAAARSAVAAALAEETGAASTFFSVDGILYSMSVDAQHAVTDVALRHYPFGRELTTEFTVPDGVTTLGSYAFGGNTSSSWSTYANLTSIDIPDTVTAIADYAFYYNAILQSIDLPDTVTSIGASAFRYCTGLTRIDLPSSLETLGQYAFANASNLQTVTFPEDASENFTAINNYTFYYCSSLTSVSAIPATVETIGTNAFYYCSLLQGVELAQNSALTTIGNSAFAGNSNNYMQLRYFGVPVTTGEGEQAVTEYVIPAGVTSIGTSAFAYCALESVSFAEGSLLNSLGNNAFDYCSSLEKVDLSETQLTTLADYLFQETTSLETVELPSTLTSIGATSYSGRTFLNSGLTSITIPAGVTTILRQSFAGCTNLGTVTFEEGSALTQLADNAVSEDQGIFYNCVNLTEINLPDALSAIPAYCFYGCTALSSIDIPTSAVSVGAYAFYGCSELGTLDMVPGLQSIGESAFYGCTSLERFELYGSIVSVGLNAFGNCPGITFGEYSSNAELVVDDERGIIYNSVYTQIISAYAVKGDVEIPDTVISVPDGAFANNDKITSVTLPSGITEIPDGMFTGSSNLKKVVCLGRITSIGAFAFENCTALTTLRDSTATQATDGVVNIGRYVTVIWGSAFRNCDSITDVVFESGGTSQLVIGGTSNSGGRSGYTFAESDNLTEIELPARVRDYQGFSGIGSSVFARSGVQSITFEDEADSAFVPTDSNTMLSIGMAAFAGSQIESIELPDYMSGQSLAAVGSGAFDGCVSLTAFDFGASVNPLTGEFQGNSYYIGSNAFRNCVKLGTEGAMIVLPDNVNFASSMATNIFMGCTGLTEITLPAAPIAQASLSSFSMGSGLFVGCTNLNKVTLTAPQYDLYDYSAIGSNWFAGCTNLTTVDLQADNLVSIFPGAFAGCSQITSISLPASLQAIGNGAFYGCTALTGVSLPEGLTDLGGGKGTNGVFEDSGITAITIPASVATIADRAFAGCTALASIAVDEDNTAYKSVDGNLYSADGATLLQYAPGKAAEAFEIPAGVTAIAAGAFAGSNINSVTIPESVTSLGEGAFAGCENLTSVDMSASSLTAIPASAFEGCGGLDTVTLPANLTAIGDYAFAGTGLSTFEVPAGVISIGDGVFANCHNLTAFTVASGNNLYSAQDGNLYANNGTTLLQYAVGKTATSFNATTVNGVAITTIAASAFEGATHLQSVTIGASVSDIGERAFAGCTSIASFIVEEGNNRVFVIGNALYVHYNSGSLMLVAYAAGAEGTSFTVGDDFAFPAGTSYTGVVIGAGAFAGSNLTEVNLSKVVATINSGAFDGAADGLTIHLVYYTTTTEFPGQYSIAGWTDYTNGMITCTVVFHAETLPAAGTSEA